MIVYLINACRFIKNLMMKIIESLLKDHALINIDANDQIDSISQKIIEKLGLN